MSKKTKQASETAPEAAAKRPVGRPSTFPEGTTPVAFPSRVSPETIERLQEMSRERGNPFGLAHNSLGAELHRIVEQAYRKFAGDRDRRASRKATPAAEEAAS